MVVFRGRTRDIPNPAHDGARVTLDALLTPHRDEPADGGVPPLIPFDRFMAAMRWKQGEHVTLIGQTGSGKTTLALALLNLRRYVCVIATKPRDRTFQKLREQGYTITREWPVPHEVWEKVVFWPRNSQMRHIGAQRDAIADCLESIYETGGWTVYLDEIRYVADPAYLGLRTHIQLLLTQGRALDVSVVGGSQRPAWVPLECYSQATHLLFWRESDDSNLKRVASIGGIHTKTLRELVPRLPHHECLYVNTVSGRMLRTRVDYLSNERTA
jgi:hypothetical protein